MTMILSNPSNRTRKSDPRGTLSPEEKENREKNGAQKTGETGIGQGLDLDAILHAEGFLRKRYPDGINHDAPEEVIDDLDGVIKSLPRVQEMGATKVSDEIMAGVITYLERFKELLQS